MKKSWICGIYPHHLKTRAEADQTSAGCGFTLSGDFAGMLTEKEVMVRIQKAGIFLSGLDDSTSFNAGKPAVASDP
jgi:hypothetical protein